MTTEQLVKTLDDVEAAMLRLAGIVTDNPVLNDLIARWSHARFVIEQRAGLVPASVD